MNRLDLLASLELSVALAPPSSAMQTAFSQSTYVCQVESRVPTGKGEVYDAAIVVAHGRACGGLDQQNSQKHGTRC